MLAATFRGFDAALGELEPRLDAALDAALERIGQRVADEARANHPFQNRTGDLEASIRALDTHGSALDGTLVGGAIADEEYASFVEAKGFQFLEPAWQRVEGEAESLIDDALESAARAAGW